eukprot:TRINITY_DN13267_c1_g1_i1.p1 TRINITY_DN13267_c1_g1~~TRINITY_DN13267_c1_g1_i1.p1  ORF type:complete len:139 (-),score=11.70 TRINITY_DN13267_c1_g1_i1:89-505(-)
MVVQNGPLEDCTSIVLLFIKFHTEINGGPKWAPRRLLLNCTPSLPVSTSMWGLLVAPSGMGTWGDQKISMGPSDKKNQPQLIIPSSSLGAHKFNGVQSIPIGIQSIQRCIDHLDECKLSRNWKGKGGCDVLVHSHVEM